MGDSPLRLRIGFFFSFQQIAWSSRRMRSMLWGVEGCHQPRSAHMSDIFCSRLIAWNSTCKKLVGCYLVSPTRTSGTSDGRSSSLRFSFCRFCRCFLLSPFYLFGFLIFFSLLFIFVIHKYSLNS